MWKRLAYETDYQRRSLGLGWTFLTRGYIHCNLQITYRCNFCCAICDFWREPRETGPELTVEQVQQVGRQLKKLGTMVVSLGGGEPLLREDLYKVIGALRETGHFPVLITNGWFVTEQVAHDVLHAGLQEISVSLDYRTPEKHDAMRGVPGAFDRAVAALERFHRNRRDKRQRVHMISVLLDDNLEEIEGLIQLAKEIGVTYMVNLYSTGRGAKSPRQPDGEVTAHLLDLKRRYPEFVTLTSYLERFDQALAEGGIGGCQGGRLFLNIGSQGEVSRCIDTLTENAGNILTDDIFAIRDRLYALHDSTPCGSCWTSCRGFSESMHTAPRLRQFREFHQSVKRTP